jgi:Protein of unknown function (DUF2971)
MSMENNGLAIEDWDAPIYRTYSLEYALGLFKRRTNGLVHPSRWDDPFENFFLKNGAVDEAGNLVMLDDVHKDFYGQCWTLQEESDALWRIYSPTKGGVCIATTIRKLFGSFYDPNDPNASQKYFIGRVNYVTREGLDDFIDNTSFEDSSMGAQARTLAETLLIKRKAFEHEKEIRLLFNDYNQDTGKDRLAVFRLLDQPNSVFDKVLLDPRLTQIVADAHEAGLKQVGCLLPISRATLYDSPSKPIKLNSW